jgi:AraC-like DNA-binding protein
MPTDFLILLSCDHGAHEVYLNCGYLTSSILPEPFVKCVGVTPVSRDLAGLVTTTHCVCP